MAEESQVLQLPPSKNTSLTRGLTRNILFNLAGWVWPIGLSMLSVPYIVSKLGNDAYGVFSLVSIAAGYLGLINNPFAMGNVRFMAEAYANEEWSELRKTALSGLLVGGTLSFFGALIMFLAAGILARNVFHVPPALASTSVVVFRLASVSFFLNGIVSALQGIPSSMRRFDIRNQVSLIVGTLNTVGIVLALSLGWGLLGAVLAQVFSSVLALALFFVVSWRLLHKFRRFPGDWAITTLYIRRLASFSLVLFAGQISSLIGLQIDITLVGILMSTSAVAFYAIPTRITDKIPGFMRAFSGTLFPLSSEAVATGKLDELLHLYHEMIRILFFVSALVATPLMILSKDFLALWIGPEYGANSWLILALLAGGAVSRSPGSVTYQVSTGMGRADIHLVAAIATAVSTAVPVLMLVPRWGGIGAALGMLIGLFLSNLAYDLFVQRRLLGGISWGKSLAPYIQIILAETGTIGLMHYLPGQATSWFGLLARAGLISLIYVALSLAVGILRTNDIKFVVVKSLRIVKGAGFLPNARK